RRRGPRPPRAAPTPVRRRDRAPARAPAGSGGAGGARRRGHGGAAGAGGAPLGRARRTGRSHGHGHGAALGARPAAAGAPPGAYPCRAGAAAGSYRRRLLGPGPRRRGLGGPCPPGACPALILGRPPFPFPPPDRERERERERERADQAMPMGLPPFATKRSAMSTSRASVASLLLTVTTVSSGSSTKDPTTLPSR